MRKQVLAVTIGVLLVLSVFSVLQFGQIRSVQATEIFNDGFETGNLSAWTSNTTTASYGFVSVQSTIKHSGTYAANATISSYAGWTDAYWKKTFASTNNLTHVRQYMNISSFSTSEYMRGFVSVQTAGQSICYLGLTDSRQLRLYYWVNVPADTWRTNTSATVLALNTEYYVELKMSADNDTTGDGEIKVYVNGAEISDLAQSAFTQSAVATITGFQSGIINGNTLAAQIIVDSVIASHGYIGAESSDTTDPTFGAINSNTTQAGLATQISCALTDETGLSAWGFAWNNTGATVNASKIAISGASINALYNGTWNATGGNKIWIQFWANDTSNNDAYSSVQTITLTSNLVLTVQSTPISVDYSINETILTGYNYTADSGSAIDIQNAVDNVTAAGGGNVIIPAGNFTFAIPSGKTTYGGIHAGVKLNGGVNIFGAGDNTTILYCNSYYNTSDNCFFAIDGSNNKSSRISGILFQADVHGHIDHDGQQIDGIAVWGGKNMRIDHCTFLDMTGCAVFTSNNYVHNPEGNYGLIDHFVIDNPYKDWYYGVTGTLPYWAYGIIISHDANIADGWPHFQDYTDYFGKYASGIWYIEDGSFARCRHMVAGGGEANSFYVLRFCTMYNMQVAGYGSYQDVHGGGLGAECYNNTIYNAHSGDIGFYSRGGFALYYNNTIHDITPFGSAVTLTNDQGLSDYRTQDVWIWSNTLVNTPTALDVYPNGFSLVENTEYFLRAPTYALDGWTYTPYEYPHPLAVDTLYGDTTNSTANLAAGTYLVTVPSQVSSGGHTYDFDQWQDSSTNPTLTVTLSIDTTITATYIETSIIEITRYAPSNTTYSTPSVAVSFVASGGTIHRKWMNLKNGTTWVYASNITYPDVETFTGLINGTQYTAYLFANNTGGVEGYATVMFSVEIPLQPTGGITSIIVNVWWGSYW